MEQLINGWNSDNVKTFLPVVRFRVGFNLHLSLSRAASFVLMCELCNLRDYFSQVSIDTIFIFEMRRREVMLNFLWDVCEHVCSGFQFAHMTAA